MFLEFLGNGNGLNHLEYPTTAIYKKFNTLLCINCGDGISNLIINYKLNDVEKIKIIITSLDFKNIASLAHLITYLKYNKAFTKEKIVIYTSIDVKIDEFLLLQGITKDNYLYIQVNKRTHLKELNIHLEFFETSHHLNIKNYGCIFTSRDSKIVYLDGSKQKHSFIKDLIHEHTVTAIYISAVFKDEVTGDSYFNVEELKNYFEDLPRESRKLIWLMNLNKDFKPVEQFNTKIFGFNVVRPLYTKRKTKKDYI